VPVRAAIRIGPSESIFVKELGLNGVGTLELQQLLLAPESASYLRVDEVYGQLPPGHWGFMLPRARYFFNVSACRDLRGDIMIALVTYLMTGNASASAAVSVLRKVHANLKRLSADELVRAIMRACPGNPYKDPVAEADVLSEFGGAAETVDDLLDSLQSKGVVSPRRAGRVQLIY
jgi:hypothetical protein